MTEVGWDDFSKLYCERNEVSQDELLAILHSKNEVFAPKGYFIAECQMLDSRAYGGQRVILPYGGKASLPEPPKGIFSPRGLASDQSVVIAVLPIEALP